MGSRRSATGVGRAVVSELGAVTQLAVAKVTNVRIMTVLMPGRDCGVFISLG